MTLFFICDLNVSVSKLFRLDGLVKGWGGGKPWLEQRFEIWVIAAFYQALDIIICIRTDDLV